MKNFNETFSNVDFNLVSILFYIFNVKSALIKKKNSNIAFNLNTSILPNFFNVDFNLKVSVSNVISKLQSYTHFDKNKSMFYCNLITISVLIKFLLIAALIL